TNQGLSGNQPIYNRALMYRLIKIIISGQEPVKTFYQRHSPGSFHTQPPKHPQVEAPVSSQNTYHSPLLFCQLQVVFSGPPKTTLPLTCGTPMGSHRTMGEKPAQLGFSSKKGHKTF